MANDFLGKLNSYLNQFDGKNRRLIANKGDIIFLSEKGLQFAYIQGKLQDPQMLWEARRKYVLSVNTPLLLLSPLTAVEYNKFDVRGDVHALLGTEIVKFWLTPQYNIASLDECIRLRRTAK